MTLARTKLVQYRTASITPDLTEILRKLETRAAEHGNLKIQFSSTSKNSHGWDVLRVTPGPTGCAPEWSMVPGGREVYLRCEFIEDDGEEETRRNRELNVLWGFAVPLGLTPWLRYPLPGKGDDVFHYLGPWQILYDHLLSVGRGEEAWPSVACAAQVDVGAWTGNHPLERFVQSQLHRMGVNCGPEDGIVGPVTSTAIQRVGLHARPLTEVAQKLLAMQRPQPPETGEECVGHIIVPGKNLSIVCSGQVAATRTATGAALGIEGPGRVIVDIP